MVDFYSVKLRKTVSVPEENCVKRALELTTKNNKITKRYMVSSVQDGLKLSMFLSAENYAKLECKIQN